MSLLPSPKSVQTKLFSGERLSVLKYNAEPLAQACAKHQLHGPEQKSQVDLIPETAPRSAAE